MARRGRPPLLLELTPEEEAELTRRVRAPTSSQRDAARARIILACTGGGSAREIAQRLVVPVRRVERWRSRFLRKRLPLTRTIEQVRQAAIDRGLVPKIGWTTVQRILSQGDVRPHLVRGWLHSPDPQFREKVTEICDLYLNPPPGTTVLCIDEMTGLQALEHRFPDHWGPGRPRGCPRREWEYKRHGTQTVIAAFDVRTGKVVATCGATRKGKDLMRFMRKVAAEYPQGTVHIIWDNLNIHYDGPTRRWSRFNRRNGGRFVFHYTPRHASWVNQVEMFFSIVHRQGLRHGDFHSLVELRAALLGFIAYWNRERAHPFRWSFSGYPLQSEEKLARSA